MNSRYATVLYWQEINRIELTTGMQNLLKATNNLSNINRTILTYFHPFFVSSVYYLKFKQNEKNAITTITFIFVQNHNAFQTGDISDTEILKSKYLK